MTSSATIPHSDIGLRRDGAGDRAMVFMHAFSMTSTSGTRSSPN